MNRLFHVLLVMAALLSASVSLVFADAALPPWAPPKLAPVAIPAAIVVAAVLIIRAIRNKR